MVGLVGVLAVPGTATYGFKAGLDARQEVPPVRAPLAHGTLSGTLAVSGTTGKLVWKLELAGLSGAPQRAAIHYGRLGRRGALAAILCRLCTVGSHGTLHATAKLVRAIRTGGAYIEVETRKHPRGEIRGQLRLLTGA